MPVWEGNVSGSVSMVAFNIPCTVNSFWLTSRSASNVIVNVYLIVGGDSIAAVPVNLTMISGSIWYSDIPILLLAGSYFLIVTNGSLDYYFSIT